MRVATDAHVLYDLIDLRTEAIRGLCNEIDPVVAAFYSHCTPVADDSPDVRIGLIRWGLLCRTGDVFLAQLDPGYAWATSAPVPSISPNVDRGCRQISNASTKGDA